ncbi:MAG TPA: ornithine cyclodeaminase family protein [Pyrinomonadaceae bacterium]|nr:ornithine cyclodeaminase family protein [Pyrinomonadaceae bacterium]
MGVMILNEDDVQTLLPMNECIDVMERAFIALARGEVEQPLRTIFRPPEVKGVMALMPTFRGGESPLFGLKAICVIPGNAAIGKDAHQGAVILFDGRTGEVMAIVNASAITAIRTAAVSGLATKVLANKDASTLGIIGAGVQARAHLSAIACVRKLERVKVAASRRENAERFAAEMRSQIDCEIEPADSSEAAVRDTDIIVTATTSREPVVQRAWLKAGAHVNAIGTFSPKARELDTETMAAAAVFVDRRESAFNEAGDYLLAASEGAIGPESILAELGEVIIGKHPGRTSGAEITVFKSLGLAMEDLAAAEHCYRKAMEQQRGTLVAI